MMIRQGDVLLIPSTRKAISKEHREVPRERGRVVVALGETSLHAHVFRDPGVCMLRREGMGDAVVTLTDWAELIVEGGESAPGVDRHDPVRVAPGTYVVRTQREWTGEEVRNAAD
jgi:hypothetical protein